MNRLYTNSNTVSSLLNINFDRMEEVTQSAATVCRAADSSGLFSSAFPSSQAFSEIRRSAKKWVQEIDSRISGLSPAEALDAMAYYDIMHRIAYCKPPYPETINRPVIRAFEAYIRGDKSIDQYDLFRYISSGVQRRDKAYFGRPLQWRSICLERWHRQFLYGASLDQLNDYDTLQRVTILLESDLWAFETRNETAFKERLFNAYRHYLTSFAPESSQAASGNLSLDQAKPVDTKTLKALEHFLFASRSYLSDSDFHTYKNHLSKALETYQNTLSEVS